MLNKKLISVFSYLNRKSLLELYTILFELLIYYLSDLR